jgi:hypothetical protein
MVPSLNSYLPSYWHSREVKCMHIIAPAQKPHGSNPAFLYMVDNCTISCNLLRLEQSMLGMIPIGRGVSVLLKGESLCYCRSAWKTCLHPIIGTKDMQCSAEL